MVSTVAVMVLGAWAMFATAMWFTAERPRHSDPCLHSTGSGLPHELWVMVDRADPYYPAVWHRGGLEWFRAPKPPRQHSCKPQTCSIDRWLNHHDRCACGGERFGTGPWMEVNKRWNSSSQFSSASTSGSASAGSGATGSAPSGGLKPPQKTRWPVARAIEQSRRERIQRRRRQDP